MPAVQSRYFQLAILWLHDLAKFARYGELVAPIVRPYGAGLERQFKPSAVYAQGMELPHVVNLVYYESKAAYEAFLRDPKFREVVHLRNESITMASVEGHSEELSAVLDSEIGQRLFMIELARFATGEQGYRAYEREAEPVMKRYGYSVDRVLTPESFTGLSFSPDIVKIVSFESREELERMHHDPAHPRIEHALYPAAVAESIWLVASAAPRKGT